MASTSPTAARANEGAEDSPERLRYTSVGTPVDRHLYDPANVQPKVDGGSLEVMHTRVSAGWWFVSELDD